MLSGIRLTVSSLALCLASSAGAQVNLGRGKTGAQLYASNCAACHKSPQSVSKATGIFGLESFLREHYTTSGESAAAIATYLKWTEAGRISAWSRRQAHDESSEVLRAHAERIQRGHSFGYTETTR